MRSKGKVEGSLSPLSVWPWKSASASACPGSSRVNWEYKLYFPFRVMVRIIWDTAHKSYSTLVAFIVCVNFLICCWNRYPLPNGPLIVLLYSCSSLKTSFIKSLCIFLFFVHCVLVIIKCLQDAGDMEHSMAKRASDFIPIKSWKWRDIKQCIYH